jgi:hypothetical protein
MELLKELRKLINIRCIHRCRYSHDKNKDIDNNICCFNCIYRDSCNAICGSYKIGSPPDECEDRL